MPRKPKIMNFVDGPKEIAVGDKVFYTNGRDYRLSEGTVKKVGNQLVYLKSCNVFYLKTGREKSEVAGGRIYSSLAAYEELVRQNKFVSTLQIVLRNNPLPYDKAVKVAEVLGLTDEQLAGHFLGIKL